MSRPSRDGTGKLVSRDQILRRERGQGNIHFPSSADHEQDWQPYPVDPYSALCDNYTLILFNRHASQKLKSLSWAAQLGLLSILEQYCAAIRSIKPMAK